ncbi:MAG: cytochrome c [Alphaproteobacteria bacterium]|nr:cytochrome c [Alphaproteobacteria bacterium]MBU0797587.1 cytochrome c [Alphaproteobacteria bacterium]MBU0886625.1 cytochrome c [Alphaproteobacteria bacterium]MBU1812598.1 cytochrome c [Alphaproteobacteria bacterium]
MKRAVPGTSILLGGSAVAGLIWVGFDRSGSAEASGERLERGRAIYAANCASCHGANLEGQPDWKSRLPSGHLPAPPHDASGHTWHHPDGVLFRITKQGPAAVVGGGYQSDMPSFTDVLSDDEIRAALDFIKSIWPERERQHQAELSRREKGESR